MSQEKVSGHGKIERNVGLMAVLISAAISLCCLAVFLPLMCQSDAGVPAPGV